MKKHGFLVAFAVLFLAGCYININDPNDSEGNGRVVCCEKDTDEFDTVVLEGVGDVKVHPGVKHKGKDYGVVVITDSNLQDSVSVDVNGASLYIGGKKHWRFNPTKLVVEVYLPELKCVNLQGFGDIKVHEGKARNLKIKLSGVGTVDAEDCPAENVDVALSGTGDVKTWAEHTLTGKLSGIGDIYYKGNPAKDVERTGMGKVRQTGRD